MMWKLVLPVFAVVFAVGLGFMTGGFQDINVNDEAALQALKYAVDVYNRGLTNEEYLRQAAEVISIKRQVVAGLKYLITVKMVRTSCRKDRPNEVCEIQGPAEAQCTFTVTTRPWESMTTLEEHTC